MINSIKKYGVLIFVGLFCLLYNPPLFRINSMHVVGAFSILYLIKNYGQARELYFRGIVAKQILCFGIISICLFFSISLSSNGNLQVLLWPFYYLLDVFPFGICLIIVARKKKISQDDFFSLFLAVSFVQALLAIAAFISPIIQGIFLSMLGNYGYEEYFLNFGNVRLFGLSGNLTFSTPILQSVASLVAINKSQEKGRLSYLLVALLLLLSAIINARISIIVFLLGLIVLLITNRKTLVNNSVVIKISIGAILLFVFVVPFIAKNASTTYEWIRSGVFEIVAFLNGDRATGYFAYISHEQNYPIPKNIITGEGHGIVGNIGYAAYGVKSDIGYINDLWRGGILYMTILYSWFFKIHRRIYKTVTNKMCTFLGLFFMLLYPIIQIKGSIYNMNDLTNFLFLLLIISSCTQSGACEMYKCKTQSIV